MEIVHNTTANDSNSPKTVSVDCPAGKRLVGGGAYQDLDIAAPAVPVAITQSSPTHAIIFGISDTQWTASAEEYTDTANSWRLRVYAICASA